MTTGSPAHDPPETMRAVVLTGHGGLDHSALIKAIDPDWD